MKGFPAMDIRNNVGSVPSLYKEQEVEPKGVDSSEDGKLDVAEREVVAPAVPKKPFKQRAREAVASTATKVTAAVVIGAGVVTSYALDQFNDADVMSGDLAAGCQVVTPGQDVRGSPAEAGSAYTFDITHAQVQRGTTFGVNELRVNGGLSDGGVGDGKPFAVDLKPRMVAEDFDSSTGGGRVSLDLEGNRAYVAGQITSVGNSQFLGSERRDPSKIGASIPLPRSPNETICFIVYDPDNEDGADSMRVEVTKIQPATNPEEAKAAALAAIAEVEFSPTQATYDKADLAVQYASVSLDDSSREALKKRLEKAYAYLPGS